MCGAYFCKGRCIIFLLLVKGLKGRAQQTNQRRFIAFRRPFLHSEIYARRTNHGIFITIFAAYLTPVASVTRKTALNQGSMASAAPHSTPRRASSHLTISQYNVM